MFSTERDSSHPRDMWQWLEMFWGIPTWNELLASSVWRPRMQFKTLQYTTGQYATIKNYQTQNVNGAKTKKFEFKLILHQMLKIVIYYLYY